MIIVKQDFSIIPETLVNFIINNESDSKEIAQIFGCSVYVAGKIKNVIFEGLEEDYKIYSSIYEYRSFNLPEDNSLEFLSKFDVYIPETKNCYLIKSFDLKNNKEIKGVILLCESVGGYFFKELKFFKEVKRFLVQEGEKFYMLKI